MVSGQVLGLDSWSPSFHPDRASFPLIPLWVQFSGLSMDCWIANNLFRLNSFIGDPIQFDEVTGKMEKGQFARVLVKVDLSKPL